MTESRPELYVSTDIECDGPCPGLNSMLSIASVVLDPRRGSGREAIIETFSANLDLLPGAKGDPETMEWWSHPDRRVAWEAHRRDVESPEVAMKRYAKWLGQLPGAPIFVGYPSGFDFTFVYYYLHRFARTNPFVRNAIDIETYAMAMLGCDYLQAAERNWPERWFDRSLRATHVALDDAIQQGVCFLRILHDRRSMTGASPLMPTGACPTCSRMAGALLDGPHTYAGDCKRRKMT